MTDVPRLQLDYEENFTRVPNTVLEAFTQVRLSRTQYRICNFILRRTYGWHHSYDRVALKHIAAVCGGSKQFISRQIIELEEKHILRRIVPENGEATVYALVTDPTQWSPECFDYSQWQLASGQGLFRCAPAEKLDLAAMSEETQAESVVAEDSGSQAAMTEGSHPGMTGGSHVDMTAGSYVGMTGNDDQTLAPPQAATPLKKELKKVKERRVFVPGSIEFELAQLLLIKIKEHLPQFRLPDMQKWSRTMDYIIRLDRHPPEEVKQVILFTQAEPFWSTNVLNPEGLRRHYDRLNLKRLRKLAVEEGKPKHSARPAGDHRGRRGSKGREDWRIESEEYDRFFE